MKGSKRTSSPQRSASLFFPLALFQFASSCCMPHSLTCLAFFFASAHSRGVPSALPCQIHISLGFPLMRRAGRTRGSTYKSPILPAFCTLPPSPPSRPHRLLAVHSADGRVCRRGTAGLCLSHSVEQAFLESRSQGARWGSTGYLRTEGGRGRL
jgi:hypothetical protein